MTKTKTFDLEAKLTEWDEAKRNADYWAQKEKDLRTEIFANEFPTPERGTNKKKISHGMALIGDYRLNYKVDRPLLEATMSDAEHNDNVLPLIHDVISFRPEVKPGAWNKLDAEGKKLLGAIITEAPGLPGIEIKAQNKVRW